MWTDVSGSTGGGLLAGRDSLGVLILTVGPPIVSMLLVHCNVALGGDLSALVSELSSEPLAVLASAFALPR